MNSVRAKHNQRCVKIKRITSGGGPSDVACNAKHIARYGTASETGQKLINEQMTTAPKTKLVFPHH